GFNEIVLTGIHISSYGLDTVGESYNRRTDNPFLAELVEKIDRDTGIERIRLGSLEPRIVTEDFARRISGVKSICPHFHLSLQSGSDTVLKRMNRHYTIEQYAESLELLKNAFDKPAVTTDVIVGFPGETEQEFEETVHYLESSGLYMLHVFKFSSRKGTRAAGMPGQLTERVKHERSKVLIELSDRLGAEYLKEKEGSGCELLIERKEDAGGHKLYAGHTREYIHAFVPDSPELKENMLIRGRLINRDGRFSVIR
ncbi:MAG: radical SAM protein, partial [Lachnospiraceae bacterium]|nr:radical SAM protein [Lachnospiraceae bacterium]